MEWGTETWKCPGFCICGVGDQAQGCTRAQGGGQAFIAFIDDLDEGIGCSLSHSTAETELGEGDLLQGRVCRGVWTGWTHGLRVSKAKGQALSWAHNNPMDAPGWGRGAGECP